MTLGLKDIIIVETCDAILAAEKRHAKEVKSIVNQLINNKFSEGTINKKVYRPWGFYASLIESDNWLVKTINVNPGSSLSLQMHFHRSEHWIVVDGTAHVEVNEKSFELYENQSTYIPLGAKHRLSNPGKIPLVLIEIQSGKYISEDDIVRFEDTYGRK